MTRRHYWLRDFSPFAVILAAVWLAGPAAAAEMDDQLFTFLQVEQLEHRLGEGPDALAWEAQGWIGEDRNKLWLKTEGLAPWGEEVEDAEVQALYSRLVGDFFDVQAGLRFDLAPRPRRAHAVLGLQGLAPHFFEVDAAAFVSNEGEVSARLEAEYELLLTQRLVLQPSFEANLSAETVRERGIGRGVTDVELGLRLRYEIRREFAPYVGVNWERKIGRTAKLARDEGEEAGTLAFVAGLRFWF